VFFVFYGVTWLRQDCARPAIASDFFQKSLAQGLFLESPWGIGYANAFRQTLAKRGLKPTIDISQAFDVHDFRTEVTRLQATKSQSILAAHTGAVMASFLKQAKAMNIPGNAIFVPSDNDDQAIINAAGPAAEGISLFSTESPHTTPERSRYQAQYEKRYKRKPDPLSRHAYDELLLLGRAMSACKKDVACTQTRIRSTRNFEGASGTFSMTQTGLPDRALYRKQVRNGALEFEQGPE
jgi:branched-chain amino acid transport system substrate-binding protein